MILTIADLGSYMVGGIYLFFLIYVYFLTESCAQKYIKFTKAKIIQNKVPDYNVYLINRVDTHKSKDNLNLKEARKMNLNLIFPFIKTFPS